MPLPVKGWIMIGGVACVFLFLTLHKSGNLALANSNGTTDWKTVDLQAVSLPEDIETIKEKVKIEQHQKNILNIELFYQTAEPPTEVQKTGQVVFLLHGAAFTSQTWVDKVPTIATMAALGHSVIAVDLPGYGNSPRNNADRAVFMESLLNTLTPDVRPVVVSPSMSGGFILPLLKKSPGLLSGWVPVAPVSTNTGRDAFYENLTVPTMIVFGERDTGLGHQSRDNLVKIPTSTLPQVLPKAGHPAYLDKPVLWHTLLLNFLKALK